MANTSTTLTPCKPLMHRLSWAANNPDIREDGLRELREIRLRRGLSQADLSAMTGVAEFTISEIEAGKRANPRPSTLRKLAQALEVEVADLYGEPTYPKKAEAPPELEAEDRREPKVHTGEAHLEGTGTLDVGEDVLLIGEKSRKRITEKALEKLFERTERREISAEEAMAAVLEKAETR
jgi:transcriptional regulator with XRE-family HTH domain